MNAVHTLPPITLCNSDFDRLNAFGLDAYSRGDKDVSFLLSELKRASVCPGHKLPARIASIDCAIVYRLDDEHGLRAHILVHPLDLRNSGHEISASSPLGAALLGLRVGDRMPFCDNSSGGQHVVTVEGIGCRLVEGVARNPASRC